MSNIKKRYAILLMPFIGFIIVTILTMRDYLKCFKMLKSWLYFSIPTFVYLVLVAIISSILINYPDKILFHAILFYIELVLVGFLMITTQRLIFKKYGYI